MKKQNTLTTVLQKCVDGCCGCNSIHGVSILRIGVGILFLLAGISKFLSLPVTIFMFSQVGLATWWVYIVSVVEVVGGICLILGMWTRYAAIPLGITMLGAAIITFRFGGGLMGALSPMVLFLVQVQFYLGTTGGWSLGRRLSKKSMCVDCNTASCVCSPGAGHSSKGMCACSGGTCMCDSNCKGCSCK